MVLTRILNGCTVIKDPEVLPHWEGFSWVVTSEDSEASVLRRILGAAMLGRILAVVVVGTILKGLPCQKDSGGPLLSRI